MTYEKNISQLFLTILVVLALLNSCEEQGRWSEQWEKKFDTFQSSSKIMDVIGIQPGMTVGEIGAGNGRFAVKIAARVGQSGMVYANDIDPEAVRFMEERCEREEITNLTVIRSSEIYPGFPVVRLDLVYLINTYDHLSDPVILLRNTRKSLKSEGRLAIVSFDPNKLQDHKGHAIPKETVIAQCQRAGFELVTIDTSFVYDNVYLFKLQRHTR